MNEVITILTSGSGNQIAKAFVGPEYVPQRFSIGRSFTAHEEPVSDLCSLSRILQKLENEPTKTIIRGALKETKKPAVLNAKVTHVRDGDTIEVNNVPIRLAALDCPERSTKHGDCARQSWQNSFRAYRLPVSLQGGVKTYDSLVGYCSINGDDFGRYMMENSTCKVWVKYDVWDRY